jgi:hypothetical protein
MKETGLNDRRNGRAEEIMIVKAVKRRCGGANLSKEGDGSPDKCIEQGTRRK